MKNLITHLLGDTRTAVLAALLLHPDRPQHVRELGRITGISPGTLHRELTALASYGVLRRNSVGRQVFYAADRDCPVFEELAGLLRKTAGSVDVIRTALRSCAKRIDLAFIYGSVASGTETSRSDLDLMIVGEIPFADTVRALEPAQALLHREINATVMRREAFRCKQHANDGFVIEVLKSPKLWVMGSDGELS